jgi:hypothetical protein
MAFHDFCWRHTQNIYTGRFGFGSVAKEFGFRALVFGLALCFGESINLT